MANWRETPGSALNKLNAELYRAVRAEQRAVFGWLFPIRCAPSLKIVAMTIAKRPCTPHGWTTTSAREIARESGVNRETTRLAIRRLEDARILVRRDTVRLGKGRGPRDRIELKMTAEGIGEKSEAILSAPFPRAALKPKTYGLDDIKDSGYLDFLKDL